MTAACAWMLTMCPAPLTVANVTPPLKVCIKETQQRAMTRQITRVQTLLLLPEDRYVGTDDRCVLQSSQQPLQDATAVTHVSVNKHGRS